MHVLLWVKSIARHRNSVPCETVSISVALVRMAYRAKTLSVLAAVLATAVLASPAHARTFTVDSVEDVSDDNTGDGVCSTSFGCTVRAAIDEANAFTLDPSDTIVIPAGTYDLTGSALSPSSDMQITGASPRTTVVNQTGGADRVFDISQGRDLDPVVGISGLTLSNGVANAENGFFGGNLRAAGSVVTLTDLTVTGGSASSGGGLTNERGTMTVRTSTITGNAADTGGGDSGAIQNFSDAETQANLTVENSTITRNTARLGPGIFSEGGNNEVIVANSTIVDNNPAGDPRLDKPNGGGLTVLDGSATVSGSIIARNSSPDGRTPNCASDPAGDFGAPPGHDRLGRRQRRERDRLRLHGQRGPPVDKSQSRPARGQRRADEHPRAAGHESRAGHHPRHSSQLPADRPARSLPPGPL